MAIGITQVLAFFVISWLVVYSLVCYNFIQKKKESGGKTSVTTELHRNVPKKSLKGSLRRSSKKSVLSKYQLESNDKITAMPYTNPFLSSTCNLLFARSASSINPMAKVSVVIATRNEARSNLFQTVMSVAQNSDPSQLTDIIIVDDFSNTGYSFRFQLFSSF